MPIPTPDDEWLKDLKNLEPVKCFKCGSEVACIPRGKNDNGWTYSYPLCNCDDNVPTGLPATYAVYGVGGALLSVYRNKRQS